MKRCIEIYKWSVNVEFSSYHIIGNMDLRCVQIMHLKKTEKNGEGKTVVFTKTVVKALEVAGIRLHGQSMLTTCLQITRVIFPVSVKWKLVLH